MSWNTTSPAREKTANPTCIFSACLQWPGNCLCAKADIAWAQVELLDLARQVWGRRFASLASILLKNHCKFISVQNIVILGQRTKNSYLGLFLKNVCSLNKNGEELPPGFLASQQPERTVRRSGSLSPGRTHRELGGACSCPGRRVPGETVLHLRRRDEVPGRRQEIPPLSPVPGREEPLRLVLCLASRSR